MKLNNKPFDDSVMGVEKEMNFSIDDDNPIIFEILRDKMYSNKIGSICREVSSNSRDANREAGNANLPIEIQIIEPANADDDQYDLGGLVSHLSISFKDFGVGITPDRMENVFVKYAASTKRDSNGQTGGFGLGAKTPFAYTDTFTIVTVCEWENKLQKFVYTAMIDSTRKGKMMLFEVEDVVDLPTGTQIIIPINTPQDRGRFEQECLNYTSFWGIEAVKYIGFQNAIDSNEIIFDNDLFTVFYNENNSNPYKLLIDQIPYPLDESQVSVDQDGLGDQFCIGLKFGVGQLTISANREAVQYDEITKAAIKKAYKLITADLFKLIKSKLNKFDSYLGACLRHSLLQTRSYNIHEIDDVEMRMVCYAFNGILSSYKHQVTSETEFQGRKVSSRYKFKYHKVMYLTDPGEGKPVYEEKQEFRYSMRTIGMKKYYGDKSKNFRRNKTVWNEIIKDDQDTFLLIIPKKNSNKTEEQNLKDQMQEMCDFSLELGFDVNLYSEVEMCKTATSYTKYIQKPIAKVKCRLFKTYTYYDDKYKCNTPIEIEIDRATGQLTDIKQNQYIYHIVDSLSSVNMMMQRDMFKERFLVVDKFTSKKIIFVTQSSYDKYLSKTSMKPFTPIFNSIKSNNEDVWKKYRRSELIQSVIGRYNCGYRKKQIEIFPEIFPKSLIEVLNIKSQDLGFNLKYICDDNIKFDLKGLERKIDLIEEKFPLIKLIKGSDHSLSKDVIEHLKIHIKSLA